MIALAGRMYLGSAAVRIGCDATRYLTLLCDDAINPIGQTASVFNSATVKRLRMRSRFLRFWRVG